MPDVKIGLLILDKFGAIVSMQQIVLKATLYEEVLAQSETIAKT